MSEDEALWCDYSWLISQLKQDADASKSTNGVLVMWSKLISKPR